MFGNSENDGFLDGLARAIAPIAIILFILYGIVGIVTLLVVAIRTKPLKVLMWSVIIFIVFWFFSSEIEKNKKLKASQPQQIEDTRSGAEIWEENRNNYDTEKEY